MLFQYPGKVEAIGPVPQAPQPDTGYQPDRRPIRRVLATALMFVAAAMPDAPFRVADATDSHPAIQQPVARVQPRQSGVRLEDPQGPLTPIVVSLPFWHGAIQQPAPRPTTKLGATIEDPQGPIRYVFVGDWSPTIGQPQKVRPRQQGVTLEDPQGTLAPPVVSLPYWQGDVGQPAKATKPRSQGITLVDPSGAIRIVAMGWELPAGQPTRRAAPAGAIWIAEAPATTSAPATNLFLVISLDATHYRALTI